jgi:hypothetical protein
VVGHFPGGVEAFRGEPTPEQMTAWQAESEKDSRIGTMFCGATLLAAAAIVLGVVAMVRSRRGVNWMAIVAVVLAGVYIGVLCAGGALMAARGLPAP